MCKSRLVAECSRSSSIPGEQQNRGLVGSAELTSCTGGASGFLNSERDTGRENLASMEGRL